MQLGNFTARRFMVARPLILLFGVGLMLAGCQSGAPGQPGAGTGGATPPGPKLLRVGLVVAEQPSMGNIIEVGGGSVGASEYAYIFHAGLTVFDPQSNLMPRLAQKVPTVSDGDWKVLPDGKMEVTWKLRPNAKWQDGVPLTSADYAFALKVRQDPEVPIAASTAIKFISEVVTPDPTTLVVRWKQTYIYGNAGGVVEFPPYPKHLMGDLYEKGDKEALINSPLWGREFVGLGPYRLTEWVEGSRMEGVAFDDYILGRPKIDRVILQFYGDSNVLGLNVIAGGADMTLFGAGDLSDLANIKRAWDPAGAGTTFGAYSGTRNYRFQFRNPNAPWMDVRVRRAMAQMLDRQVLVDTLESGLTTPADTPVALTDPVYGLLEQRGLTKYPLDLNQAQRLMTDAGWIRAPGGSYRSSAGQPFTIDLAFSGEGENVTEAEAVGAQWKAAGVEITYSPIPDVTPNKPELRHNFTAVEAVQNRDRPDAMLPAWATSETGTAANRWSTQNRGGYSNPEYDRLYDLVFVTLDQSQRLGQIADMLKILNQEVPGIDLFYDPGQATSAVRKGVRGPATVSSLQLVESWNIHAWEMD